MNTWSESHATSWVSYLHHKSPPCESWWPYALQKSRYFIIDLSRDLTWPLDKRFMGLYAWFLFIISHHPAKFGGHRSCRRKYILFFLFHVLSCGNMVGESCDIMGKFSSWQVTILLGLVVTGVVEEKIFCFWFVTWPHVSSWSESHVTLRVSFPHHKWLPCKVW